MVIWNQNRNISEVCMYLSNIFFALSGVLGTGDAVFKQDRHGSYLCAVYSPGRGNISIYLYLDHLGYSIAIVRNL